jgi:CRISPR system Cascade subunit CasE
LDVPGGFRIVQGKPLEIRPMVESHFRKKDKKTGKEHAAYHGGVQFRGTLEVIDQEPFIETYQAGIGSAKGFGFGLLLLAPINL